MTSSKANGEKLLTLSELLAQPLPFEDVAVPEYGSEAHVRLYAVSGLKRAELAERNDKNQTATERLGFVNELIAVALGGSSTAADVSELPSTVIDRLSKVALRLAGIGADAEAQVAADLAAASSGGNG